MLKFLNLHLFDEGGGEGSTGSFASSEATSDSVNGTSVASADENEAQEGTDIDAEWKNLIKTKFKEQYGKSVKTAVEGRLKNQANLQAELDNANKVLERVREITGAEGDDLQSLYDSLDDFDPSITEEALERGIPKETLKEMRRMERENREFQRQQEEIARREASERQAREWQAQADQVAQMYGQDNVNVELLLNDDTPYEYDDTKTRGEMFSQLLKDTNFKTAYEVMFLPEIIGGAIQHTQGETKRKIAQTIQARGKLPAENGSKTNVAVQSSIDFSQLSDAESKFLFDEIRAGRATLSNATAVLRNFNKK